jgi:hypothetical protein
MNASLAPQTTRPQAVGRSRPLGRVSDLCFALLKIAAWSAVTAGCVLGLFALFFLMLGEFHLSGMLLHLDNFAERYLAADGVRRARFEAELAWATVLLFCVTGYFRRHSLFPLIHADKETENGK